METDDFGGRNEFLTFESAVSIAVTLAHWTLDPWFYFVRNLIQSTAWPSDTYLKCVCVCLFVWPLSNELMWKTFTHFASLVPTNADQFVCYQLDSMQRFYYFVVVDLLLSLIQLTRNDIKSFVYLFELQIGIVYELIVIDVGHSILQRPVALYQQTSHSVVFDQFCVVNAVGRTMSDNRQIDLCDRMSNQLAKGVQLSVRLKCATLSPWVVCFLFGPCGDEPMLI